MSKSPIMRPPRARQPSAEVVGGGEVPLTDIETGYPFRSTEADVAPVGRVTGKPAEQPDWWSEGNPAPAQRRR